MTTATTLKCNRLSKLFDQADAYVIEDKIDEAIEKYAEITRIEAVVDKARDNFEWGRTFLRIGEYDRAITRFDNVIRSNPNDAKAYSFAGRARFNLGLAYFRKGEWNEAIECFEEAIRIKPNDTEARRLLDNAYTHIVKSK